MCVAMNIHIHRGGLEFAFGLSLASRSNREFLHKQICEKTIKKETEPSLFARVLQYEEKCKARDQKQGNDCQIVSQNETGCQHCDESTLNWSSASSSKVVVSWPNHSK